MIVIFQYLTHAQNVKQKHIEKLESQSKYHYKIKFNINNFSLKTSMLKFLF